MDKRNPLIDEAVPDFWSVLDRLVETCALVIDRPRGSAHPRYGDLIYPLDYGYLDGTQAMDGGGIDVWLGVSGERRVVGIVCTVDGKKRDAEIKILLGCAAEEIRTIFAFLNSGTMRALVIERPAL